MKKILLDALNGHTAERVPFWFMRQAGRYLPEYRSLRIKKGGFLEMIYDPVTACEITMQPLRRFGMDAAIIFSDILVIPHALGRKLDFLEGEGPVLEPLRTAQELARIDPGKIQEKLQPVYETLARTKAALSEENFKNTALIGFAGAPWTVAAYMIEGRGRKDFAAAKTMAYGKPEIMAALMDVLVESTASYLVHQARAGAQALQIFDSWAGLLDETLFRRLVIEPTRSIMRIVRREFPDIPVIGFPRGAGHNYLSYAEETGVTAVGLDSQVPVTWAARTIQPRMPVQGNLDPACLLAGGETLVSEARRILEHLSKRPFIFNLGHGIQKDTPPEHVERLARFVKEFRVR